MRDQWCPLLAVEELDPVWLALARCCWRLNALLARAPQQGSTASLPGWPHRWLHSSAWSVKEVYELRRAVAAVEHVYSGDQ